MQVFVWISHGNVEVYSLETQEQKDNLKDLLVECLLSDGVNTVNAGSTWKTIYSEVQDAVESRSDMFQYGTGIVKVLE